MTHHATNGQRLIIRRTCRARTFTLIVNVISFPASHREGRKFLFRRLIVNHRRISTVLRVHKQYRVLVATLKRVKFVLGRAKVQQLRDVSPSYLQYSIRVSHRTRFLISIPARIHNVKRQANSIHDVATRGHLVGEVIRVPYGIYVKHTINVRRNVMKVRLNVLKREAME